jgi:hypothetical protein
MMRARQVSTHRRPVSEVPEGVITAMSTIFISLGRWHFRGSNREADMVWTAYLRNQ